MEFAATVILWLLLFVRFFGFLVIIPTLRAYLGAPGLLAISASASLLFADLTPVNTVAVNQLADDTLKLLAAGAFNLFVGILLGLPLAIVGELLIISARTVEISRGAHFGEQLNPLLGARETSLEMLAGLFVCVLLFNTDAYQSIFSLLLESLELGIFSYSSDNFLVSSSHSWLFDSVVKLSSMVINSAILLAAPVLICGLLIDAFSCLIGKGLARINIAIELLPLRMLLGIGAMMLVIKTNGISSSEAVQYTEQIWRKIIGAG